MAVNNSVLVFVCSLWIALASCGEVFEENISEEEIFMLAPGDSVTVSEDTVTFWWEWLDGARHYEFRLVSPSFSDATTVVADSVTTQNRLKFALSPGNYEWELRAFNNGYSTPFYYRKFMVDSLAGGEDISDQVVTLSAPGHQLVAASTGVSFLWEELSSAEKYELLIVTPNFDSISTIFLDTIVKKNLVRLELDSGRYEWGVRALAGQSKTKFFTRSLTIDPE